MEENNEINIESKDKKQLERVFLLILAIALIVFMIFALRSEVAYNQLAIAYSSLQQNMSNCICDIIPATEIWIPAPDAGVVIP